MKELADDRGIASSFWLQQGWLFPRLLHLYCRLIASEPGLLGISAAFMKRIAEKSVSSPMAGPLQSPITPLQHSAAHQNLSALDICFAVAHIGSCICLSAFYAFKSSTRTTLGCNLTTADIAWICSFTSLGAPPNLKFQAELGKVNPTLTGLGSSLAKSQETWAAHPMSKAA